MKQSEKPLFDAIDKKASVTKILTLIASGINVNATDDEGGTPLMWAIFRELYQIVPSLIEANTDVNAAMTNGITALMILANQKPGKKQFKVANLLLDANVDVNAASKNGVTPLMLTAKQGNFKLFQELLKRGSNPTATDRGGRNALKYLEKYAKEPQKAAIKKILIPAMLEKDKAPLVTALSIAPHIATKMIRAKIGINQPNEDGITPLIMAAQLGQMDFMVMLLKAGADLYAKNAQNHNIFNYAAENPLVAQTLEAALQKRHATQITRRKALKQTSGRKTRIRAA